MFGENPRALRAAERRFAPFLVWENVLAFSLDFRAIEIRLFSDGSVFTEICLGAKCRHTEI